ncbi:MAG: twin-arginine translocase subunit TatC [Dehalococcoidia bacterium]|nr:twin-arginine translocase subunit TatC [Dehalococcoidia bacterium]
MPSSRLALWRKPSETALPGKKECPPLRRRGDRGSDLMLSEPLDQEELPEDEASEEPHPDNATPRMSLFDHLEEFRSRLIKVFIGLVITTACSFFMAPWIFDLMKSRAEGTQLIRTGVAEMVGTYMKVSLMSGVALAMPLAVYQLVMFISPGLRAQEKRFLYFMMPVVFLSFLLGAAFAFFILLPPGLNFLIHFGEEIATPLIRIGDYVSVVSTLTFWLGLSFETPIVIFVLTRIGLITPAQLTRHRRLAFVGAFVLGAVITPTLDPFNQTLVAVPLMLLYEIGILLSKIAFRQRNQGNNSIAISPVKR